MKPIFRLSNLELVLLDNLELPVPHVTFKGALEFCFPGLPELVRIWQPTGTVVTAEADRASIALDLLAARARVAAEDYWRLAWENRGWSPPDPEK